MKNKIIDREILKERAELRVKLWKIINDIDYSVEDYELRADNGDYTPNDKECILINDYAQGLLDEVVDAIIKNSKEIHKLIGE